MAETRKHRITVRDELDAQQLAQLGEQPVRPFEAGSLHGPAAPEAPPAAATAPKPAILRTFTFGKQQP